MAKEIQQLLIKESISVGTFKVEVSDELNANVIKFDNGDIKVRYSIIGTKASYITPPVPKEHAKLVWQKAQQQQ